MEYEFAPLEGITDAVYRRAHRRYYPGLTRYYTPFISPTQNHCFTPRQRRELAPENNAGVPLVPQLLGKNADDFLWAAGELAAMGYGEVNLNLGCPSGTVTAKGKGAGLLARREELDRFLEAIFSAAPLGISVKTRLGDRNPAEFEGLMEIFEKYPIVRLAVHARTRQEQYRPGVHPEVYAAALARGRLSLSYNGDLFTPADCRRAERAFPGTVSLLLGRGLAADPALAVKVRGEDPGRRALRGFHRELCEQYPAVFGSRSSAMHRMKAIWHYLLYGFQNGDAFRKRLVKARRWEELMALTGEILDTQELLPCLPGPVD